jgi:hypothetical protein
MQSEMDILRNLVRLFNKLRQKNNIPLSVALLDYAYGGNSPKDYYLTPEYRRELAKAIEIHDLGYDFADLTMYEQHNNLSTLPTDLKWMCLEENGVYVCLDKTIPNWLKKVHQKRKEHQKEMKERKERALAYDVFLETMRDKAIAHETKLKTFI